PLHRFQEDGGGLIVHRLFQRGKIAEGHVTKTLYQGLETLLHLGLSRRADHGQGSTMKRIFHANDFVFFRRTRLVEIFPCKFHGPFVRLGAAVAKEDAVGERNPGPRLGQIHLGRNVIQIGDMDELGSLFGNGFHQAWVAVPEYVHGDAPDQIEIFFSAAVEDPTPFALHEGDRKAAVGIHDDFICPCNDRLISHLKMVPTPLSVKISNNTAWLSLPSIMWALLTPALKALMQHSTLGIIPPLMTPFLMSLFVS